MHAEVGHTAEDVCWIRADKPCQCPILVLDDMRFRQQCRDIADVERQTHIRESVISALRGHYAQGECRDRRQGERFV